MYYYYADDHTLQSIHKIILEFFVKTMITCKMGKNRQRGEGVTIFYWQPEIFAGYQIFSVGI